jgi:H+-transporting ATPase
MTESNISRRASSTSNLPGLSSSEAKIRLDKDGPNQLPEKKKNAVVEFLKYYWGPMPFMIWIAIAIEGAGENTLDAIVLLVLQFFNGFIGWYEEKNAGNAIAALKKQVAARATVKRDGVWENIPAVDLVVGDLINIKLGDIIPADCRAGPGTVEVDQSALTGESLAVTRSQDEEIYQGSAIKRGKIEAIIIATGQNTFFGRTSKLISAGEHRGHFQIVLLKITGALMAVSLVMCAIIFAVVISKGNSVLETLSIVVVLLIASIPIAIQIVSATTMAVGAHKLAKSKAIVSRLNAIEEMAGIDLLCSDKTGTLTMNILTVGNAYFFHPFEVQDVYLAAGLASNLEEGTMDAIDKCIVETARETYAIDFTQYEELSFTPYDPVNKKTEADIRADSTGEVFKVSKGAPQVMIGLIEDADVKTEAFRQVAEFAAKGYRTIGVARFESAWSLVGLIPLYDPPREDTAETVRMIGDMHIGLKMVTGDQLAIAKETARLLNMGDKIVGSSIFQGAVDEELADVVEESDGFAEVLPEHKFAIVKLMHDRGHRVAMTGDGVNDAPALKKADVGIAVDGATDAARAASDIILTSPGLSVIIEAVVRSRKIFQRMRNFVIYRIACTIQLLVFFFISMIGIDPSTFACQGSSDCSNLPNTFALPVLALVLITLLNDLTLMSTAYDRVAVSPWPEKWNLRGVFFTSIVLGSVACVSSILLLFLVLSHMRENQPNLILDAFNISTLSYGEVLTAMYLKIAISDFLTLFASRTTGFFWSRLPSAIIGAALIFATLAATLLSAFWYLTLPSGLGGSNSAIPDMKPIAWRLIGFIWGYNIIFFLVQDVCKVIMLTLSEWVSRLSKQPHAEPSN